MIIKQVFITLTFIYVIEAQNWLGYINQFNPGSNLGQPLVQTAQQSTTEPPSTDSSETKYDYPCGGEVVQMTRPGGHLTADTNYWNGRVDLTDFTYLKSIKLVIKVDQAAEITVDPEVGTISGPKTGKTFRVTYEGAPPDVNEVNFHIRGLQSKLFPNLVSLHLNNREICSATSVSVSWYLFDPVINDHSPLQGYQQPYRNDFEPGQHWRSVGGRSG